MCKQVQGVGHALRSTGQDGWASADLAHYYPEAQEMAQLLGLVILELPLPDMLALEPSLGLFPRGYSTSARVSVEGAMLFSTADLSDLFTLRLKILLLKRLLSLAGVASPLAASPLPFWGSASRDLCLRSVCT